MPPVRVIPWSCFPFLKIADAERGSLMLDEFMSELGDVSLIRPERRFGWLDRAREYRHLFDPLH